MGKNMSQIIEQAEAALASAHATYLSELERESKRSPGSEAQELRREEHLDSLRDAITRCERDLDEAKRIANQVKPASKGNASPSV